MIDLIEKTICLKKENKVITIEYAISIILAFGLWGYYMIYAGIFSFTLAKEYNFNLSGLTNKNTFLGPIRVSLFI